MNSDANIVVHLCIGPKVNGQQNLTGFIEFFNSMWWIMVDMLVISVVERYFRLGLKYLTPLGKKIIYCIPSLLSQVHSEHTQIKPTPLLVISRYSVAEVPSRF